MKRVALIVSFFSIFLSACRKTPATSTGDDFNTLKEQVISDFVNRVALPWYALLKERADLLNTAIINLDAAPTETNLIIAKQAWKNMRSTWEKCEGFLFGPVDEDEHDPETDTWPVNFVDMDALLASTNPLGVSDIEALTNRALKGYHPIEYILWGNSGHRTAASLTTREKLYVKSLSVALKNQAEQLYQSWSTTGGNYADKVLKAGKGSTVYTTRQHFYITILEGLIGICDEVAEGKMKDPFITGDPQIVESPFSGNSVSDFKDNITGAYYVYLGEDGKGLNDLVKSKNIALDNEIQQKFNAAIGSFASITVPYEQAIMTQKVQCQNVMTAINTLAHLLDTQLRNFIITHIAD